MIGVEKGRISFAFVMTRSADLPLEINSAISVFLTGFYPSEMDDDSIWIDPSNDQNVYIYCGPGQGPFLPCIAFATGFGFEL
jgi:hypothetical protein